MKLITKEIQSKLTKAGYHGDKAICKFFCPWGAATWVIFGQDEECPDILFAVADLGLGFVEAGSVSLSELELITGPIGLRIERDLSFTGGKDMAHYLNMESLAGCC